MRIGFTSIYSWRPHAEHVYYLSTLARQAGHEVHFLSCDGDLATCYGRELRPDRSAWLHCTTCRAGGLRSYTRSNVTSLGREAASAGYAPPAPTQWSWSSAGTLARLETEQQFAGSRLHEFANRLEPAVRHAYASARRWIESKRLDGVYLFNGRIDVTRAVLEAARDAEVPFVSVERTWFGDGLQLLPNENCLGLSSINAMMRAWRDVPLSREQALHAGGHVASRFLRRNAKEWRAYNLNAQQRPWPAQGGRYRVLLAPSSRNEMWGHADWNSAWPEPLAAFDAMIDRLGLRPQDLVLRCHPNWGERIGSHDGSLSERYYTDWATQRGIIVIASTDSTSTLGLIEQADAVVVCGGSAALEAGVLGKQVIATSPSLYRDAGFQTTLNGPTDLPSLRLTADLDASARLSEESRVARHALRFCHTMVYRVAQYVPHVRAITTTRYEYRDGADAGRIEAMLRSGALAADDASRASDEAGETHVLGQIANREWQALMDRGGAVAPIPKQTVQRRWMFRPVDSLREALPRGDR